MVMRKLVLLVLLGLSTIAYSQKKQPTFKAEGDLVKATYYHDNGAIKTQGFFKDSKLDGKWVSFDKEGNKLQLAFYEEGRKVGKWLIWTSPTTVKEIIYENNTVVSVNEKDIETGLAINND